MESAKPWHILQVQLYCTMFNKDKGVVFQPLQDESGVYLKHLITVDRNDEWYQEQLENLYKFHLKVLKVVEKLDKK